MRPTRRTQPDEWSRANRTYSPSAAKPGARDPSYTPFLVPFAQSFDLVSQRDTYGQTYDVAVLACGSQMGKTDTTLDIIGWTMDQRPAPIMYFGPSKDFLQRDVEPRLMEMLTGSRRLREKLATGKRSSRFRKWVGGVPIALAWAGSSTSFRGMSAKYVLVDELDAMDDVQNNGDPFSLTESRVFSYTDGFRAAISTPLLGSADIEVDPVSGLELWRPMSQDEVQSPIWRLWQSGTRHQWTWPCLACGERFVPRFKQLKCAIENPTPAQARRDAYVECPRCGGIHTEEHKAELNARGVYVAPGQAVTGDGVVTGPPPDTTILSFWVSGLASPFKTFGERLASHLTAKLTGEQSKIQTVFNTGFGELFMPGAGDVAEWEQVKALGSAWAYAKLDVPAPVRILTLAVDVQKNRLVYTIRGWGAFGTSWLVDYGDLHGETVHENVWDDLALLLKRPIGPNNLTISRAFIDSGYRPGKPDNLPLNRVYDFCRRFPKLAYPTKGRATQEQMLIVSRHEVTSRGSAKKYGLDLVLLHTDLTKSWVHERILWPVNAPGAWYLPSDITDDYCKAIVSEARVRAASGKPEWVRRSRNNHYLDCEAMQAALQHMLNLHLLRDTAAAPVAEPDAVAVTPSAARRPLVAIPQRASAPPPPAARPPATVSHLDRLRNLGRSQRN